MASSPPPSVTATNKDTDEPSKTKDKNIKDTATSKAIENLRLGTLYGSISIGLLISSFAITMPHAQSRRDELQCDSLCFGSMTSTRSALNLIGSALMGRLSDSDTSILARIFSPTTRAGGGRVACLYIGAMATVVGSVIGTYNNSIAGLWMQMIPTALLQQNFSVLKAMLADYHETIEMARTSKNDDGEDGAADKSKPSSATPSRAGSVGKLGMTVGLAFMAGPIMGSTIATTYSRCMQLATVLAILSAVFISWLPPTTTTNKIIDKEEKSASEKSNKKGGLLGFLNVKAARTPSAMYLMVIRVSMALSFHIFNTIWPTSLRNRFQFGPSDHGKFMSFIGLSYALSQGVVAKSVVLYTGNSPSARVRIVSCCCIILGLGRYVAFQTQSLFCVYVTFGFIITALGVINTILTADTSGIAPSNEMGGLYGALEAVESAAGMIGPIVGGSLAYIDPVNAPLLAVVGLYLVIFALVQWGYEKFLLRKLNNIDIVKNGVSGAEHSDKKASTIEKAEKQN
uniref:Major facilitator superfamily (MFS) profile domain-containing protein n=1 Tax=Ditylum brightwellii TaxID=49249 RepID=A0A7S4T497_9STRA